VAAITSVSPPPSQDQTPAPAASWRDRYTLGPGDIFDFSLYGKPELDRGQVFVRPDGRIGYLQASDVMATGLTIDELRSAIEAKLTEYHHNPRVIITPVELRSKHYVVLGKVVDKGVFALDQPITIIEAVARARGVETGLFEGNTVELADLPRSFIVRNKSRLPVDFEKLFFEGDLSQNVQIEPGDFIYFASAISNDVFVLGEVGQPGVLGFTPRLTALGCITVRGGFSKAAYRSRVLIVRGSLQKPQVIVVNVNDVLAGKAPDVALMPKDIIYVSRRPWILAEELTDMVINTFLSSMTSSWTDRNLGPWLPGGSLPQAR
jgi:protein involved in polysaccharide export with SLBB domain